MAIFKEFSSSDITTTPSFLNQLVDIVGSDICGVDTRRKYQVFVTGAAGSPGVTSSLFQTVYDQKWDLQTANPVMDITVGLHVDSPIVQNPAPIIDINGKYYFPQDTLMMREKMDIYRMFAQTLLGDANATFIAGTGAGNQITEALFIPIRRLFARDQIKRETFALRVYPTASLTGADSLFNDPPEPATKIYTDANAATNKEYSYGGQVSTLVDAADTSVAVGLVFNDRGVVVLDITKGFDNANTLQGEIDAVTTPTGTTPFNGTLSEFLRAGSLDDIIDHFASIRFTDSPDPDVATVGTAITFQNITNINSTIYTMQIGADEFNYSSNPTYTDSSNRIVVIDPGQEETQRSFTFITGVGLYDAYNNLLAVGKVSRPIYKSPERPLTLVGRLDF